MSSDILVRQVQKRSEYSHLVISRPYGYKDSSVRLEIWVELGEADDIASIFFGLGLWDAEDGDKLVHEAGDSFVVVLLHGMRDVLQHRQLELPLHLRNHQLLVQPLPLRQHQRLRNPYVQEGLRQTCKPPLPKLLRPHQIHLPLVLCLAALLPLNQLRRN